MRLGKFSRGLKPEKRRLRALFFKQISESSLRVIRSLRKNAYLPNISVLPVYSTSQFEELDVMASQALRKAHPDSKWSDYEYFDAWHPFLMADDDHYPELIPIRNAVLKWSRTYNLDADWCRDIALKTLDAWARKDSKANEWELSYGGVARIHPIIEDKLRPLPDFPLYLPFRHSSVDEYLKEVERWMRQTVIPQSIWYKLKDTLIGSDSIVSELLDSYIRFDIRRIAKIVKRYCKYVDYFYAKKDYKEYTSRPDELRHIKWAVRAQVGEETLSAIAKSEHLGNGEMPNTAYVSREVKKVLSAISLPPRTTLFRQGKPKRR